MNRDEKTIVMVVLSAITFGFVAAVMSTLVHAETLPVSTPDKTQVGSETLVDCARNAFHAAITASNTYEEGGMFYKLNSKYYYTLPVSQERTKAVDYRVQLPAGSKAIALYHTHPGTSPDVGRFSPEDVQLAHKTKLAMFVAVVEYNQVLVMQPDTIFALDPSAEPPVNQVIENMLKTDKAKDVVMKYMRLENVSYDTARLAVNAVIRAHEMEREAIRLLHKLEM